jgi:transposase
MKLTTNLHLLLRSRMVELYHHSSIHLHGTVLNGLYFYHYTGSNWRMTVNEDLERMWKEEV